MNITDGRSGGRVADEAHGRHTGRQLYNLAYLIAAIPTACASHVRGGIIEEHDAFWQALSAPMALR